MYYSYDDIKEFNKDDFEVGDVICGDIFGGGYTKGEIEFVINKKYEVQPRTKADCEILSDCWKIDKDGVEDLLYFANSATSSVSTIIEFVTSTEINYFTTFEEWLAECEGIDIADLSEDEIEIKRMELEKQSIVEVYSNKEYLYMMGR